MRPGAWLHNKRGRLCFLLSAQQAPEQLGKGLYTCWDRIGEEGGSHCGLREDSVDVDTQGKHSAAHFKHRFSSCVPLGRPPNSPESALSPAVTALTFRVILMSK